MSTVFEHFFQNAGKFSAFSETKKRTLRNDRAGCAFDLLFVLLAEAVFFAGADALDVGAVHIDDHCAHDGGADHAHHEVAGGKALEQTIDEGQHRIGCRHRDAAQRDHAGGDEAEQEDSRQKRQQDGLDGQNGPARHQNALAALEAEIDGLRVADDRQNGRHINAEVGRNGGVLRQEAKDPAADADCRNALQDVARRREGSGFFAEGAQHIGHPCRAAAVVADVVMIQVLADQNAGVDAAQQVGLRRCRQHKEERHHVSDCPLKHLLHRPYRSRARG